MQHGQNCFGKTRLIVNHLPGLILHSADSSKRPETGGNYSAVFLLFLMRQAAIEATASKMNSLDSFVAKIGDADLKSYFSKPVMMPADCSFDRIKADKSLIIEDALVTYRVNLALACNASKRHLYKLVEEVAGLAKIDPQVVDQGTHGLQVGGFIREFPKTFVSSKACGVCLK